MVIVTHGDVTTRPPLDRADAFTALETAVQWWGADVPDDPGVGELAQLLDEIVERLRGNQGDERSRKAAGPLAEVAEALRAVARLGTLLPVVSLWHLRTALQQEAVARRHLTTVSDPHPAGEPLSVPSVA
ncbi:hypothetical protein OG369_39355 [Streptomyces sp. NBC_01221]|uniref:hypothetical protein n=1 Tax=Streptomyces sp. NBC_01221 TaxID=2903782 RepID=UPI00225AB7E0|nr:hypothetical protein [Streptomyces sp. NBC_01221]MCX4791918.1 hypothetical protein [Streptomyces sp. NBC_01221]